MSASTEGEQIDPNTVDLSKLDPFQRLVVTELASLQNKFTSLDGRFTSLEGNVATLTGDVATLTGDMDTLTNMVTRSETKLDRIVWSANPMMDPLFRNLPVIGQLDRSPVHGDKPATWSYMYYYMFNYEQRLVAVCAAHCGLRHWTDSVVPEWQQRLRPQFIELPLEILNRGVESVGFIPREIYQFFTIPLGFCGGALPQ